MKFYFLRMKSDEVGTTLKHPETINGNVKNLSKRKCHFYFKNLTLPLIASLTNSLESLFCRTRRYWPKACLQSHWKWSKIIIFKSAADRRKSRSNRSDLCRNRPVYVNRTGLAPNRPVHYRFGTKPVGRSGFGTGSDRWPNESVKPADSGPNRTDF